LSRVWRWPARLGDLARHLRPRDPQGQATEKEEIRVSRFATIGLGMLAIVLGILFEKMNIAFMVGLAFGVAASANFPVLILSMYWKGLTTRGALWGGYGGVISAVLFVLFSKSVWVDVLGNKAALFPYTQPALFAMPIAFIFAYIFSKSDTGAPVQAGERSVRRPVRARPDRFRRFRRQPLSTRFNPRALAEQ
jgi:cation/acetate symporter